MKIVLTGVETNNKGAELMLYAILQEIERRFPDAEVFLHESKIKQGRDYLLTDLNFKISESSFSHKLIRKFHINGILRRLHLKSRFVEPFFIPDADYLIDGSGLHFSDKFNLSDADVEFWQQSLLRQKSFGTKIVFLPQAFGPLEMKNTLAEIKSISDYADLIYAREQVSYNYLLNSKVMDMSKVKVCTDFTSLVEGVFPKQYEHLKNAVCVIPNKQMVRMGVLSMESYVSFLVRIVNKVKRFGKKVFLLNHEGVGDEKLAYECQKIVGDDIEVVSRLNALETKGLISTSYLLISSRFHGVASALNSCVPCLATSWSHKYECLFADYGLRGCLLSMNDLENDDLILEKYLTPDYNNSVRQHLVGHYESIVNSTKSMWNEIWLK